MASPSLSVDPQRPSLSPADCHTLQKMVHDVRSHSPLSPTPCSNDGPASRSNLTETSDIDADEDNVSCESHQFAPGDERQDGYEDEDDSMEVSDGEDAFGADETDRDTIEDIMNMPGKTAPSVPVCDYSSLYPHDQQAPDGAKELSLRRASIEKSLKEQCQQRMRVHKPATADGIYDANMPFDHVLNRRLAVSESYEASSDRRQVHISSNNVCKVSGSTLLTSTSFIDFPLPTYAVVQTPNGKHIDFATSDVIPYSSLDNTLDYFRAQEGDEISPHKHRCNTSSSKTTAELARETRVEEEEAAEQRALAELDQFRDMDLAPTEKVMGGGPAGDLITFGTPVKAKDEELFSHMAPETFGSEFEEQKHTQRSKPSILLSYRTPSLIEQDEEDDADVEESDTAFSSEQRQPSISPRCPTFITVIGMLPVAMFWATVAGVVNGSSKAFDVLIEKLTGLKA
ncbi:hypothetical protein ACET3X_007042 [Alternaria dauci]|uniref:Uncharacterized protein n=1 Tax=Alternaria dauci TaxID=48095 RepID=A0ABR3UFH7_9PLEO